MIFEPTPLAGAFVIVPEELADNRGFFARLFCADTFASRGLNPHLDQISISYNARPATVRGMHLQRPPAAEAKIVRVTAGTIFDVIVDVRRGSDTYGRWFGTELSATNRKLMYIPEGFAHGFQTLVAASEVTYHISRPHAPDLATGLRYDDPDLGITWPLTGPVTISERDGAWAPFRDFVPIEIGDG